MPPTSALPDFYYFWFAVYEPFLTTLGFLGTLSDPTTTHNYQASWPIGTHPPEELPPATFVTIVQLAHVCALLGLINCLVFTATRRHLHDNLPLQEKIVWSLMTPLLIGDVLHITVTLWGLGDQKFDLASWSPMMWTTNLLGLTLMIPRLAWHLGIGRYVDTRDRRPSKVSRREKSVCG